MNHFSKFFPISGALLFSVCAVTQTVAGAKSQPINKAQDTTKAAEYFENELNFTTNAYGVKNVVDGTIKNVTIIDLRTKEDYDKGHIPGSINLPFNQYNSFEGTETEFSGLRKDGYNYVYCYTAECNLAKKAGKRFASLGYPVKEIVGGFDSWKEHGSTPGHEHEYPIEVSK